MKTHIISLMILLASFKAVSAQIPDADFIIAKSRDMSLTGSLSANIKLTITEKNGSTRSRTISITTKSYPDGLEKRFIKFLAPADVRGTSMLVIDNKSISDEMWIYLPALKKIRRIVSSEKGRSFMSSEFSNADMSSPTLSDFVSRHLDQSGTNNKWIIESKPLDKDKANEYGYSKKISYLDMDNYQISKMEFYNFDNELFKTIEIKSIYPLPDGKFLINKMIANNIRTNRKSEIVMEDIKTGTVIDDSYFSMKNLEP